MLVSHQYKFIFIHIYKTGGSSVQQALQPFCKPNLLKRALRKINIDFISLNIQSEVPHHPTAIEIKNYLPKKTYDSYFKFTFVRNPWDMEVSLYHYMLQTPGHRQYNIIRNLKNFDEYIEWRVKHDLHSQSRYVIDKKGNTIVDFIGKFENIDSDFQNITNKLGINAQLPRINQSIRNQDYRVYYNEYTKELVSKHFNQDIDRFGYQF